MKKLLLAAAALVALSTAASAADLPRKSVAPVIAVPMFSWTGFYVGLNAGYAWGESRTRVGLGGSWSIEPANIVNAFQAATSGKVSPNGFTGGAQIGYNHQIGALVLGIEADFSYLGLKKSASQIVSAPFPTYSGSFGVETTWLATIRPRLGVAFNDNRTMIYATGGVAFSDVEGSWTVVSNGGYRKGGSKSDIRTGWTIGGGLEHAFTTNLTAKLEYLYTDMGKFSYASAFLPGSGFPTYSETIRQDLKFHTVRVGLNYKF